MNERISINKKKVVISVFRIIGLMLSAFLLGYVVYTFIHA